MKQTERATVKKCRPAMTIGSLSFSKAKLFFLRHFVFSSRAGFQIGMGIVDFAPTGFLDFVHEGCSIVALGIGQRIGLTLVIPAFRIQALGLFEMGDRIVQMSGLIEMLAEPKLGCG